MRKLLILIIATLIPLTLAGCKKGEPEFLEGFPIEVPADQQDPLFFDGLDPAFEALRELES